MSAGAWGEPTLMPTGVSAPGGSLSEVVTANQDGTVDLRNLSSRATRQRVRGLAGWTPTIGDRVLSIDLNGNVQTPAIIAVISSTIPIADETTSVLASEITALQGRATALESPVHFFASCTAATILSGSDTVVPYTVANSSFDPVGAFDNTNHQFVAPISYWYDFDACLRLSSPGANGLRWIMRLYINGGFQRTLKVDWTVSGVWSNDYELLGRVPRIPLVAGDRVDIRINQGSGGSLAQTGDASSIWFAGGLCR